MWTYLWVYVWACVHRYFHLLLGVTEDLPFVVLNAMLVLIPRRDGLLCVDYSTDGNGGYTNISMHMSTRVTKHAGVYMSIQMAVYTIHRHVQTYVHTHAHTLAYTPAFTHRSVP